jgi:hypothetical protein
MPDQNSNRLSLEDLANVLAEVLYIYSATELGQVCDRLKLGPSDSDPMGSKRRYVRERIRTSSDEVVLAAASKVSSDFARVAAIASWRGNPVSPSWVQAYDALAAFVRDSETPPQRLNLVFATTEKPDIVVVDVPAGRVADRGDYALIFDEAIGADGLTFAALKTWWIARRGDSAKLYPRLLKSLGSAPERAFFDHYYRTVIPKHGPMLPALLPQVWLQYDPVTRAERAGLKALARQRLDFLMLCAGGRKVIVEIDGPSHILGADGRPDFGGYQQQLVADRAFQFDGYEVYRFGVGELSPEAAPNTVDVFISRLGLVRLGSGG